MSLHTDINPETGLQAILIKGRPENISEVGEETVHCDAYSTQCAGMHALPSKTQHIHMCPLLVECAYPSDSPRAFVIGIIWMADMPISCKYSACIYPYAGALVYTSADTHFLCATHIHTHIHAHTSATHTHQQHHHHCMPVPLSEHHPYHYTGTPHGGQDAGAL